MSDSSPFRLLGQTAPGFPDNPEVAILETFPNRSPHRDYWVSIECAEFTSLCPVTGQPDFARITIRYVPDERCVETKSLKFYLASFRNTRAFNEEIINRILEDFVRACSPRRAEVRGEFSPRGGLRLVVEAAYPAPAPAAAEP